MNGSCASFSNRISNITIKYVPIDPLTTIVPSTGRWSPRIAETWSNSRWSAVCIITTGGRQLEPVSTVKPAAGSGGRALHRPYAYAHRVGGGHFYGLTSQAETATHHAGSGECLVNRDGISATHRSYCSAMLSGLEAPWASRFGR